jgi:FkbM family methyltransferase
VFLVIRNPLRFFMALLRRRAPSHVVVRTPVGLLRLELRNFESVKTLFSIFCRQDYPVDTTEPYTFVDIGANIGLASAYFLSRHTGSGAVCFEPDPANLDYLRNNLRPFGGRATIIERAVAPQAGTATFYLSEDGKYSSLVASGQAQTPQIVATAAFASVLRGAASDGRLTIVKLDVEGMEPELAKSAALEDYRHVHRLICDHPDIGSCIGRPHRRALRNGYVDDLTFET